MRQVIFSVLLALLSSGANAQAFGVNMGDPVSRHKGVPREGISYLISVPNPNPQFESYIAFATPSTGICKVVGLGKDQENDDDGTLVRGTYEQLQRTLNTKYGANKSFDFLKSDALWKEDREFIWSILKNERFISTFWDVEEGSTLPPKMQSISIKIAAITSSASYITLTYQFDNFEQCRAALTASENAGL